MSEHGNALLTWNGLLVTLPQVYEVTQPRVKLFHNILKKWIHSEIVNMWVLVYNVWMRKSSILKINLLYLLYCMYSSMQIITKLTDSDVIKKKLKPDTTVKEVHLMSTKTTY